jgi:hypothetical protein
MGFRAFFEIVTSRFILLPAVLASLLAALWLVPLNRSAPPLEPIEMASPAQMQEAMERINEDHEAIADFLERQQAAENRKAADRARALEAAREQAANEARIKTDAATRELGAKASAARRAAETPQPKSPRRQEARAADTPAEGPVADPLPITPPPAAAPKRGPIERAVAAANEVTDRTLAAADAVRSFLVSAAGRIIGGVTGTSSSNLTSSY